MFLYRPFFNLYKKLIDFYETRHVRKMKPFAEIKGWKDVPYIDDGKRDHFLDIYHPVGEGNGHLILDIHGGSYAFGYKEVNYIFNSYFVARGFSIVSMNYSLVKDNVSVYDQIRDVFAALDFLYSNRTKYGLCFDNFAIMGDSAGGHLALMSDLIFKSEEARLYYQIDRLPDIEIKRVALNCTVYDFEQVEELARKIVHRSALAVIFSNRYSEPGFLKANNPAQYIKNVMPDPLFISSCHNDFLKKHSFKLLDDAIRRDIPHRYHFEPTMKLKISHVYNLLFPESLEGKRTNEAMVEFFLLDERAV